MKSGTHETRSTRVWNVPVSQGEHAGATYPRADLDVPWYLRPQPKFSKKKVSCRKPKGQGKWLVVCPCCGVDWEPSDGHLALQVVRLHVDAHSALPRVGR
jgi:hypothetical protein